MAAVIDPALLDRLLDLPVGVPVIDPAGWARWPVRRRGYSNAMRTA